ncbi:hypothetical protein ACGFJC_47700 [Nonomuraea fuscirosea]|uniref:hypothetical protein n=1 Tax=Nonomuraea fuscirosea TaxID=1291556 RepID=UPI00371733FF
MTHENGPVKEPSKLFDQVLPALFDQAVNNPVHRADLMANMGAVLSAVAEAGREEKRRQREARRNRPEAIAARKAAARKGWETRRRNAEEKARQAQRELDEWAAPDGPWCNQMSHNSRGSEVFCYLEPGHEDDEHTNGDTTWPRDENETESDTWSPA